MNVPATDNIRCRPEPPRNVSEYQIHPADHRRRGRHGGPPGAPLRDPPHLSHQPAGGRRLKLTAQWTRGTSDYIDNAGASLTYGVYVFDNGDKFFTRSNLVAQNPAPGTADNTSGAASGNVAVGEDDTLTAKGTPITGKPQQAFNNVMVATFTDTDTGNVADDLTAPIDWGDGTTTAGTVAGSNGSFSVSGTHTYATSGQDTITVKSVTTCGRTAGERRNEPLSVGQVIE
jgi:hypothetical protein